MAGESGWQLAGSAAQNYERFVRIWMEPWSRSLVAMACLGRGQRVLDVACGTGLVARIAADIVGSRGVVVGLDINQDMLETARTCLAAEWGARIEWRQGDATNIALRDGSFDVVLCQQGLQYFPDRLAALREMRRVLVDGGRAFVSVWRPIGRNPFFDALAGALERHIDGAAAQTLRNAFGLGDRDELRGMGLAAGFGECRVRMQGMVMRHPSLEEWIPQYLSATPFAPAFASLADGQRKAFATDLADSLVQFVDDDGVAAPMEAHVLVARR